MTNNMLKYTFYVGIAIALILFIINLYASALVAIITCGVQQLRIESIEAEIKDVKSEVNVYKSFIFSRLCKYKEGIFNGKSCTKNA